jgi:hypothetical protein
MITLENGVTLDPNTAGAKTLNDWARYKGLNVRAFTTSIGTYLLVENTTLIFEHSCLEDCAVHLDIMALDKVLK